MARNKLSPGDFIYSDSLRQVFKFEGYLKLCPKEILVQDMNNKFLHIRKGNYRLANDKEVADAIAKKIIRAIAPDNEIGTYELSTLRYMYSLKYEPLTVLPSDKDRYVHALYI